MFENKFTENDEKMYVEALNWIAKNAKFGDGPSTIQYMIQARNHFSHLQSMAEKISANVLEIKAVRNNEPKKDSE